MPQSVQRTLVIGLVVLSSWILTACSGNQTAVPGTSPRFSVEPQDAESELPPGWPSSLPTDGVQPWEQVDAAGLVVTDTGAHATSAIDMSSVFVPGVERFLEGGFAADNGEACTLTSVIGSLSFAIYRVPLGGDEPGVVSVDANVTAGAGYYVGLGDYGGGAWQWHGPFRDNHIRLSTAGTAGGADYTSSLGNVFVCVAAFDGTSVDVVGIGVNHIDNADNTAPPAPSAPSITEVAGGLLLEWLPVTAGDLAGYRVYYSSQWFLDGDGAGVHFAEALEGMTAHLLGELSAETFVRISAVDISGNESALSGIASGAPLAGLAAQVSMTLSAPSCLRSDPITLSVAGADTYDYDIDGDGLYDSTGNGTPVTAIVTSATGIIRPHVRAYSGGVMIALGGVSLIITGNTRPVASAIADPSSGEAELQVTLTGIGEDIEDDESELTYAWDVDGDGFYEPGTNQLITLAGYPTPKLYNVKFRVTDTGGAWDVDTVPVLVTGHNQLNNPPFATVAVEQDMVSTGQLVTFNAAQSNDTDGSIALYEWDFNGDGAWDASGTWPIASHSYSTQFAYNMLVRVTDNDGGQATGAIQIIATHGPWTMLGHDTLHTGRSQYRGPQTENKQWSFPTDDDIACTPAISSDGMIYFGSYDHKMYALYPTGLLYWYRSMPDAINCSPAIGPDGTIYVGCHDGKLYAIYPYGFIKWSCDLQLALTGSPTIGADGTIYIGGYMHKLYAVNPDGTVKWSYTTDANIWTTPAIGPDGTIYFGGIDQNVYALYPDGTLRWSYPCGDVIWSSPAIDPDGNVYIGCSDNNLYCLYPNGGLAWTFPMGGEVMSSPAIAQDRTIYIGSDNHNLYAIYPDGSIKWAYLTGGTIWSSPVIGSDGVIYFGSNDGSVYALRPNGTKLWSYEIGNQMVAAPAIAADGTILIGSYDNSLHSFGPMIN